MKAVAVLSPGQLGIVEIPMPPLEKYECRVKVLACGICNGTDLKIIDNQLSDFEVKYPAILGHEDVNEVVEVGSQVRHIRVGDRFTNSIGRLAPGVPYTNAFGAMKEFAIVQDHRAMEELGLDPKLRSGHWAKPIPREMDPIGATVLLTLKETCSALINFGFQKGMDALVFGDGPVGLALCQFLRFKGASWIGCVGHHADRLETIGRLAAPDLLVNGRTEEIESRMAGRRIDLVVDAVGSTAIIRRGSKMLKPGGKVGCYGVLKKSDRMIAFNEIANNVSLHTLNWPYGEHSVHGELVNMVMNGQLNLKHYYSHVLPMEQAEDGVRRLRSREALKVVLTF